MPLYIISLVEHKTQVEYNVIMQLLRYMVHIWEDYEKEMEQAITMHILRMVRQSASDVEIAKSIMQQFSQDERQAAEKLALAFGDSAAEE